MKALFLLIVFLILSTGIQTDFAKENDEGGTFECDANGITYVTELTSERIKNCPEWQDNQPNPPISVRAAMAAAMKELPSMVEHPDKWELRGVTLELLHGNKTWVYKIIFLEKGWATASVIKSIFVIVPMDGTAIHPKIIKPEMNRTSQP